MISFVHTVAIYVFTNNCKSGNKSELGLESGLGMVTQLPSDELKKWSSSFIAKKRQNVWKSHHVLKIVQHSYETYKR